MNAGNGGNVRVLIADDDPLARTVLRNVLREGGLVIAAEATTGAEAAELAVQHQPDVVVMDMTMRNMDGISAMRQVLSRAPDVRVVILANSIDVELALQSLRSGASGYLARDVDLRALPNIILGIVAGEAAISRQLTMQLIDRLRALPDNGIGTRPVNSDLTPREWQVLDRLCLGESTAGIAAELVVSSETVRSHIKKILHKLGVSTRQDAVAAAQSLRLPARATERRASEER